MQNNDVSRLRQVLQADIQAMSLRPGNPKLLMLAGLPGSGKSTFAREIVSRLPLLVLESDRLRKLLVGNPQYTAQEHSRVFRAIHLLLDEFLRQGFPVILDATNIAERNRRPVYAIARRLGVPLSVVVVTAPAQAVRQRLADREAGLDPTGWSDANWTIHCRMAPAWEPPKRPHILVDTSRDVGPALQKVIDWLKT